MAPPEEAGGGDQFPVGMKVLVVDDDPTCLAVLNRMLVQCRYDGERIAFAHLPTVSLPVLCCRVLLLFCSQLIGCSDEFTGL
jgi:hypothetical protein